MYIKSLVPLCFVSMSRRQIEIDDFDSVFVLIPIHILVYTKCSIQNDNDSFGSVYDKEHN